MASAPEGAAEEFIPENVEEIANSTECPEDARVIAQVLLSMGVKECEPRVINQLLEFAHRYTTQVLSDSLVYADHAGRAQNPEVDDVQFAIKMRVEEYSSAPSLERTLGVAKQTNSLRLPPIPKKFGLFLPPDAYCLTEVNYQIEPRKRATELAATEDINLEDAPDITPALFISPQPELPPQRPRYMCITNTQHRLTPQAE